MAKSEKNESVRIGKGKLTKSDSGHIPYGESCISSDNWTKCSAKCKSESSLIKSLGVSDERIAVKKEKSKNANIYSRNLHSI